MHQEVLKAAVLKLAETPLDVASLSTRQQSRPELTALIPKVTFPQPWL
jgi:hypothetical protein